MFRKEARTLTKLHHPALVQYRVLAQEPQLGVLYIVTDFIEGVEPRRRARPGRAARRTSWPGCSGGSPPGSARRTGSAPSTATCRPTTCSSTTTTSTRRRSSISASPRISTPSSATIVGDGFAGKLNYVAPEQLGDFGREVGPWTDVYSLGLVILAVAQGKNVDMSGSLVDAIDKRRARAGPVGGPGQPAAAARGDASARPQGAAALDGRRAGDARRRRMSLAADGARERCRRRRTCRRRRRRASGNAAKWVIVVVAIVAAGRRRGASATPIWRPTTSSAAGDNVAETNDAAPEIVTTGDPVARARSAINSVLPSVELHLARHRRHRGRRDRHDRARCAASPAIRQRRQRRDRAARWPRPNLRNAQLNFDDVAPITQAGCAALDTFRQIRARDGGQLAHRQPRFEMAMQDSGDYAGREAATARLDLDVGDEAAISPCSASSRRARSPCCCRAAAMFDQALANSRGGRPISAPATAATRSTSTPIIRAGRG